MVYFSLGKMTFTEKNLKADPKAIAAEKLDSALCFRNFVLGAMMIQVLLDLDPAPSREQLILALGRLLAQVPLLGSRLQNSFWRGYWIPIPDLKAEDLLEIVELENDSAGRTFEELSFQAFAQRASEVCDPLKEAPFRLLLFRRGTRGLLVLRVHHSVGDGNGCLQLARLLGENLEAGQDSAAPTPVPNRRNFYQLFGAFRLSEIPAIVSETAVEMLRPLSLPFLKPLQPKADRGDGQARNLVSRLVIQGEDYRHLHSLGQELGLTINDLLLTALCGLSLELNHQLEKSSPYLAVGFTVNLRRFLRKPGFQITNLSGISTLIVRPEKAKTFRAAALAVRERSGELKKKYPGLGSILGPIFLFGPLPVSLMKIVTQRYSKYLESLASRGLLLTNIGLMDPFVEPFGTSLQNASVMGPVAEVPLPVFTATGFGQSLIIYLTQITRGQPGEDLCESWAERLKYYLLEWTKP